MRKKVVLFLSTGYTGSEAVDFYEINEDASEEHMDEFAYEEAISNAERYGICSPECLDENPDFPEESVSWNIEGHWELYNPDEHDMLSPTGTPEFQELDL
mgnify:CR=1 FL=1